MYVLQQSLRSFLNRMCLLYVVEFHDKVLHFIILNDSHDEFFRVREETHDGSNPLVSRVNFFQERVKLWDTQMAQYVLSAGAVGFLRDPNAGGGISYAVVELELAA